MRDESVLLKSSFQRLKQSEWSTAESSWLHSPCQPESLVRWLARSLAGWLSGWPRGRVHEADVGPAAAVAAVPAVAAAASTVHKYGRHERSTRTLLTFNEKSAEQHEKAIITVNATLW